MMKKFLTVLLMFSFISISTQSVKAVKFEEGINQSKPMAVIVYAPWADGQAEMIQAFDAMEQRYAEEYNFAKVNIATEDAKAFNARFYIYPNLPYVLLFRNGGKVSRFLKKDCVMDEACFAERLDFFSN